MGDAQAILLVTLTLIVAAYLLAWRSKRSLVRKSGSWVLAMLAAVAGLFATGGYAIPALEDFHNPRISFTSAIVDNLFIWGICLGALGHRNTIRNPCSA
jgi:hypothetical protein